MLRGRKADEAGADTRGHGTQTVTRYTPAKRKSQAVAFHSCTDRLGRLWRMQQRHGLRIEASKSSPAQWTLETGSSYYDLSLLTTDSLTEIAMTGEKEKTREEREKGRKSILALQQQQQQQRRRQQQESERGSEQNENPLLSLPLSASRTQGRRRQPS